jgi:hypothetical protein
LTAGLLALTAVFATGFLAGAAVAGFTSFTALVVFATKQIKKPKLIFERKLNSFHSHKMVRKSYFSVTAFKKIGISVGF